MASTYTPLGVEKMTTGENAGTWGDKTNTNLQIIEQFAGGFTQQAVTDGADTDLSVTDGNTGATLAHRVIEFTGSLSASRNVTIPIDVQTFYIIKNSCDDSVVFKYVSGSGNSVTFAAGATKIVYATANHGTNPDLDEVALGDVTLTGTQTLTNKTLTSPKIGTSILDTGGNELALLTATGSAVNEFTIANAATGNGPTLSSTGETNVDINLNPKGSGVLKSATAAVKIAGKETIWIPAVAMYGSETNGADAQQVETTALKPDLKVLDFDASTSEFAQFAVTFPKSWDLGTVTFIPTWSPSNTDTGNCIWSLSGLSVAEGETADTAFSGAQTSIDAGIGTVEDIQMGPVSSAITIAGTIADGNQVFFQLERDADNGSDTFTGDARLLGIQLFYTTNAANDA
jgi:hypothetical protein